MKEISCSECGKEVRKKYMKRIRGKDICKKCNSENRKERRKETINNSGIKEKLKELDKKIKNKYNREYQRKRYEKVKRIKTTEPPKIKGNKLYNKKEKSSAYITFEERQRLFGMLIRRGVDAEEAKERISNLVKEQSRVKKLMKQKNKSEDEIKIKQQELLEELWNY